MQGRMYFQCHIRNGISEQYFLYITNTVQRIHYSVFPQFLPPQHEYEVCVKPSELQKKMYLCYIKNHAKEKGLSADFEKVKKCGLIHNHKRPVLYVEINRLTKINQTRLNHFQVHGCHSFYQTKTTPDHNGKLVLLMEIVHEGESAGDKILVYSQSLGLALKLPIEYTLCACEIF